MPGKVSQEEWGGEELNYVVIPEIPRQRNYPESSLSITEILTMNLVKQTYRIFLINILLLGIFGCAGNVHADGTGKFEPLTIQTAGGKKIEYEVEVADTTEARRIGLMYRKEMQTNRGMLLDFGRPEKAAIWMKNTYLPLDIIYIDAKGVITKIVPDAVPLSTTTMPSETRVRAVLELNGGQAAYQDIEVGDHVIHRAFNTATSH